MDFHSMIGKLRAIESLGNKQEYVAEDAPESAIAGKCNMTAEGKSCPVHGMEECWASPMEEGDAATLAGMLKNSGQLAEAGGPRPPVTAATPPTAQDSGETWADWFSRIYGGGQTVATGGEIQGADTSGGVSGNPMGDFTGDPNSTPTSVKPAVEPTVASKPPVPVGTGMPAAKPVTQASTGLAVGGAKPAAPAAGMPAAPAAPAPAAPAPTSFKDAFRAARKAAGGAGGVFMWKGKPYQTNVKGEPAKAWNSPDLKKVGSGWPTSESAGRRMKTTRVNEAGGIGGGISGGKFGYNPNKSAVTPAAGGARPAGPAAGMPQRQKNWMDSEFQPGGARPEGPAAGMPAAPEPATFNDAFRAARKAAGGAGGVFMWQGKPYQTNIKGEPAKAWNSPELKKVGSGWPTSESASRKKKASKMNESGSIYVGNMNKSVGKMRKLAGLSEMVDDSDDQAKVDDMAKDLSADIVDEMFKYERDKSPEGQRASNKPYDILSVRQPGSIAKYSDEYKYMRKGKSPDAQRMKAAYSARGPKHPLPEDDESIDSVDARIEDLMREYGVDSMEDEVNEDAPLVGMPFTSLGATNNGPEEWGMVVTGGTSTNNFNESKKLKEGFTINSNMVVTDGKATKSLTINATDDDVDTLANMLRNAGIGGHASVNNHSDVCDGCGNPSNHCTCGMNQTAMCSACNRPMDDCECGMESDDCGCESESCTCGMTLENADHDYGHDEKSEIGEPLDVEEYVWDGPHLNQRFGKIGDNTLMAERAITLFKNYSDQYSQMLEEADLDPSNAGFDSPLTANSRDEFDKDPFVDETPVDDGSRSPLSTVKRQDVMEKLRKLAKIIETTHTLYRIKVLSEAATKQDADALSQAISNFQTKAGIPVTGVLDADTSAELDAALNSNATAYANDAASADTSMADQNSAALDAQIAQRNAQKAYQSALNAPNQSAAKQAQNDLYAKQMSDPESMGWSYAEPDTDAAGNPEMTTFPSMAAANAKVNYYQPGEEAMIAGQTYVRDIDNQNKKVWVPAN